MRKIDREAEKALQDQYDKDVSRWKTITFYVTCSSFVVAMAVLILVGFGWGQQSSHQSSSRPLSCSRR